MEPINVNFTFTEDTYIKVSRHLVAQMLKRQLRWGYLLIGILVLTTATTVITGRWQMLLAMLLPIAIIVPVWRWLMTRMYKKAFAQQENLQHPISYNFTEEQVASKSFSGESSMNWDAFEKVLELPEFFLLYQTSAIANPVLKSGFENEGEISRFRALVDNKKLSVN